jgi:hypothetical protein
MRPNRYLPILTLLLPSLAFPQAMTNPVPGSVPGVVTTPSTTVPAGFEKPAAEEQVAYGFDPAGIEYRENKTEDFQIFLVESAPFAGAISYGGAALTSLARRGTGKVDKGYFIGFIVSTLVLSALSATYSVSGKRYVKTAPQASLTDSALPPLAFKASLVQMTF